MPRPRTIVMNISVLVTAALAVSGYGAKSGAHFIDTRYVHADSFRVIQEGDSIRAANAAAAQAEFQRSITTKIDSANWRLTQVLCGQRIVHGCR